MIVSPCSHRWCSECKLYKGFKKSSSVFLCKEKLKKKTLEICNKCPLHITCDEDCIKINQLYKKD